MTPARGGRTHRPATHTYPLPFQRWYPPIQTYPGPGATPTTPTRTGGGGAMRITVCAALITPPNSSSAQRATRVWDIVISLLKLFRHTRYRSLRREYVHRWRW